MKVRDGFWLVDGGSRGMGEDLVAVEWCETWPEAREWYEAAPDRFREVFDVDGAGLLDDGGAFPAFSWRMQAPRSIGVYRWDRSGDYVLVGCSLRALRVPGSVGLTGETGGGWGRAPGEQAQPR